MPRRTYAVRNLGCANCAAKMEAKIRTLPGVQDASITFATRQLRVTADNPDSLLPRINAIIQSIEPDAVAVPESEHHHHHDHHHHDHHGHGHGESPLPLFFGASLFAAGLILTGLDPETPGRMVLLAAYAVLAFPVLTAAVTNLFHGQVFDENFLMSIATLGAFFIDEFPEAVGVMLFYRIGEYFEHKAVARSRRQIMESVDLRPETVTLIFGDTRKTVPAGQSKPGDVLLVRPGDRIPLDGVVLTGESPIDTSPITGEPVPVRAVPGSRVISGCVNLEGVLTVRAEKPLAESMVTRILNSVESAAAGKPKIDRFITRFARIYTPAVVAVAAATAVIPSLVTGDWNHWVYTALSFLVMSCPCALVLSIPLAFFSGIGAGSRQGILFKGGASIEAIASVKAVAMDKTGTLTRGEFAVQKVMGPPELLALCAGCERYSTHPIAVSILAEARKRGITPETPQAVEELSGRGIRAVMGGRTLLCGNRRLMEEAGVELSGFVPAAPGTLVLVAVDGVLRGHLVISDSLKPGASEAVRELKELGITPAMFTGDTAEAAKATAQEAGIGIVRARLLPQDKLEALRALRKTLGVTMFVGDGINDAPVLAGADVGAAMGSGSDAAIEAADAVFLTSAVQAIPSSIRIARRTQAIALQNVVFALAVKAAVMVLGLLGFANMWLAVFADSGVAMLCVLNSIRMLYGKNR